MITFVIEQRSLIFSLTQSFARCIDGNFSLALQTFQQLYVIRVKINTIFNTVMSYSKNNNQHMKLKIC